MEYHIEDIKNIREELNWRVKIAYTSTTIFYGVITFVVGLFMTKDGYKALDVGNKDFFIPLASTIAIMMSLFAATLTANHLIEKKIELYILQIQKKILKKSEHVEIDTPQFSWISFLYADEYVYSKSMQKLHNFALAVFPALQYGLPNAISIFILCAIYYHGFSDGFSGAHTMTIIYYIFVCVMSVSSSLLAIVFLIFFLKVKAAHRDFFYDHIHLYFKTNEHKQFYHNHIHKRLKITEHEKK